MGQGTDPQAGQWVIPAEAVKNLGGVERLEPLSIDAFRRGCGHIWRDADGQRPCPLCADVTVQHADLGGFQLVQMGDVTGTHHIKVEWTTDDPNGADPDWWNDPNIQFLRGVLRDVTQDLAEIQGKNRELRVRIAALEARLDAIRARAAERDASVLRAARNRV